MSEKCWNWLTDCWIPSDPCAGRQVQEEVLRRLAELSWTEQEIFGVRLAMEEALVNAIKHGNREDSNKRVRFTCKVSPDRICIEVADEGPGFDPERVPNPTEPERLECSCGRGLMLMRSFMSRVEFKDGGCRVVMEKVRSEPGESE